VARRATDHVQELITLKIKKICSRSIAAVQMLRRKIVLEAQSFAHA
jgi:hypothetical protein